MKLTDKTIDLFFIVTFIGTITAVGTIADMVATGSTRRQTVVVSTAFADVDGGRRDTLQNPKCVAVHPNARYRGYGYDHIVEIDNTCDQAIICIVKTDVVPEPTTVKVPTRERKSVLTMRGSPAREFKADVQCKVEAQPEVR